LVSFETIYRSAIRNDRIMAKVKHSIVIYALVIARPSLITAAAV